MPRLSCVFIQHHQGRKTGVRCKKRPRASFLTNCFACTLRVISTRSLTANCWRSHGSSFRILVAESAGNAMDMIGYVVEDYYWTALKCHLSFPLFYSSHWSSGVETLGIVFAFAWSLSAIHWCKIDVLTSLPLAMGFVLMLLHPTL